MMKRKGLIILILLTVTLNVGAQSIQKRLTLTPRVGVNTSNVSGMDWYSGEGEDVKVEASIDTKRKWSITVGCDIEYLLTRRLGLRTSAPVRNAYDGKFLYSTRIGSKGRNQC